MFDRERCSPLIAGLCSLAALAPLAVQAGEGPKKAECQLAEMREFYAENAQFLFFNLEILPDFLDSFERCTVAFRYQSPVGRNWSTGELLRKWRQVQIDTLHTGALEGCVTDIPLEEGTVGPQHRCF